MKATFNDYVNTSHSDKGLAQNRVAREIFEMILSRDDVIIAMIDASECGKPALSACVLEIEAHFQMSQTREFDLTDRYMKQALGRMVRCVLEPFGYEPVGQKEMPRNLETKYLTSASFYEKKGKARLKVVKKIIEVDVIEDVDQTEGAQ